VLLVNGLPLVLIEAKTPTRAAVTWVDGAVQVHDDYERFVPELFVCNVFSVATEGKEFHYGSLGLPVKDWGPWHLESPATSANTASPENRAALCREHAAPACGARHPGELHAVRHRQDGNAAPRSSAVTSNTRRPTRSSNGYWRRTPRKGLIWHFQGSGKSLLMVFAAQKLRLHPLLRNPTVIIVVDRIDLDTQITGTFTGADIPNLEKAETREKLQQLLAQDVRKIIITTIFKFGEADGVLNQRHNIIALVDEAHRTQEGDLGRKMRDALPNAFLFGLTGTPINRIDRNTFYAFGADEDSTRATSAAMASRNRSAMGRRSSCISSRACWNCISTRPPSTRLSRR
jgi:type I restriction enzyme R subunit